MRLITPVATRYAAARVQAFHNSIKFKSPVIARPLGRQTPGRSDVSNFPLQKDCGYDRRIFFGPTVVSVELIFAPL